MTMQRTLTRLAQSALLLLAAAGPAQARPFDAVKSAGTIRIATEAAFKPFNYYDDNNKLTGFEVDLGNAIAKQMGLKAQWVVQPFENLLIGLGQDRYDLVIASHGITPERQKAVDFSTPHYCTGGAIISLPGGPKTVAQLAGKTVAVQVGTTYVTHMNQIAGIKEVKTFPKDSDAQGALMARRTDAWITDRFMGLATVKSQKGKLVQGAVVFQERNGMAMQKGNTSLEKQVNAALATLLKNGTYAKISQQYFGQDIRCK